MSRNPLAWAARVAVPVAATALAGGLLALTASDDIDRLSLVPVGLAFLAAAAWASWVMAVDRHDDSGVPPWWRLVWTVLVLALGVTLLILTDEHGGWFLGLAFTALALAWLVAELRHVGDRWRRGIVVGLFGAVATTLATGLIVPGGWGLFTALALALLL